MNQLGLLVLSKKTLTDLKTEEFYGEVGLIDRGYLEFTFDSDLKGVCTQLSIDLPGVSEPFLSTNFSDYETQNKFESEVLMNRFKDEMPFVLMGNTNTGLNFNPDITALSIENYKILRCTFTRARVSHECTVCGTNENAYNVLAPTSNFIIDHVLGRRIIFSDGQRVFTTSEVNVTSGLPLSDHFGYKVRGRYSTNGRQTQMMMMPTY